MKKFAKIINIVSLALFAVVVVVLLTAIIIMSFNSRPDTGVNFFGQSYLRVLSGSMDPEYKVNDVIRVDSTYKFEDLKVGDVIAFRAHISGHNVIISHRIIEINTEYKQVATKGDANKQADQLPVSAAEYVGIVAGKAGFASGINQTLSSRTGFFVVVLMPSMLSAAIEIFSFMGALFAYVDSRKVNVLKAFTKWKEQSEKLSEKERREQYAKLFKKHNDLLGDLAMYTDEDLKPTKTQRKNVVQHKKRVRQSTDNSTETVTSAQKSYQGANTANTTVVNLTKQHIVVKPFTSSEYIFNTLTSPAGKQYLKNNDKKAFVPAIVKVPASDKQGDARDVLIKIVNIDKNKIKYL